jgi:hypothetical protein
LRHGLSVDVVSLAAGAVVAAVGALVLLDASGGIDVSIGWMAVALTGGIGAILLVSGFTRGSRHDSG